MSDISPSSKTSKKKQQSSKIKTSKNGSSKKATSLTVTSNNPPNKTTAIICAGQHPKAWIIFISILLAVLVGDLVLKTWAFNHVAGRPIYLTAENAGQQKVIPYHEPVSLIPSVLSLRLTTNTGAVFGLGKGARWFFIAVSIMATIVIGRFFLRSDARDMLLHICLASILGGALGNLYDRVVYHQVRDMLWLFPRVNLPFELTWPSGLRDLYPWLFNLADVALVVGVLLLLMMMFWPRKSEPTS